MVSDEPQDRSTRRDGTAWKPATLAARAGKPAGAAKQGIPSVVPPVLSSGFELSGTQAIDEVFGGKSAGYVYGRYDNPTVDALEEAVSRLEGTAATAAYSSGMAAIAGAFEAVGLVHGDRVLAARDLYGTTITWLETTARVRGWELRMADFGDALAVTRAIEEWRPKAVYCEVISNPLVRVVDLPALGAECREIDAALIVDGTFAPPPLLRAIDHGATLVLHSATKYLGGHGDLVAGVLSGAADLVDRARARRRLDGTIVDPFSAWLALRGMRTLVLRMERQCDNARRVAGHLLAHPRVERVHYPGLGHRDTPEEQEVLAQIFPHGRCGAMVAFEIAGGGTAAAGRFLDALELWGRAPTLGDLDSLALLPWLTSHRPLDPDRRRELGIGEELVRLSVGIEDADDLVDDLDRALAAAVC